MDGMAEDLRPLSCDEDVDGILMVALKKQGRSEDDLRQRLKMTADEMGISEAELAEAEREYARHKEERSDFLEFRRRQIRDFREHLFTYLLVNAFLVVIDFWSDRQIEWAMWPIIGWGIGIGFHAWGALNPTSDSFLQEFDKFRRKSLSRMSTDRETESSQ